MGENMNPRSFFGPVLRRVGDCRWVTLRQFVATAVPAAYRADGVRERPLAARRGSAFPAIHAIRDRSEAVVSVPGRPGKPRAAGVAAICEPAQARSTSIVRYDQRGVS